MNTVMATVQGGFSIGSGVLLPVSIVIVHFVSVFVAFFLFGHQNIDGSLYLGSGCRRPCFVPCFCTVMRQIQMVLGDPALHHNWKFVRQAFVVEGQEACGVPSPFQLKPVSPPGELGPGLQDS